MSTSAVEADTAAFERWMARRPVPESLRPFFRALLAKRNALASERDALAEQVRQLTLGQQRQSDMLVVAEKSIDGWMGMEAEQRRFREDERKRAKAAEAALTEAHDIISSYEAVTNPEEHPELLARSQAYLGADVGTCGNPTCERITTAEAENGTLRELLRLAHVVPCDSLRCPVEVERDALRAELATAQKEVNDAWHELGHSYRQAGVLAVALKDVGKRLQACENPPGYTEGWNAAMRTVDLRTKLAEKSASRVKAETWREAARTWGEAVRSNRPATFGDHCERMARAAEEGK